MFFRFAVYLLFLSPALADTVVTRYSLKAGTVITDKDLMYKSISVSGAFENISEIIGRETKIAIYAGQPIFPRDIAQKALIFRNQPVSLRFERNGIIIETAGRSLSRARVGERAKVMNLVSKRIVHGVVLADGTVSMSN